jgi:hypothetical protein
VPEPPERFVVWIPSGEPGWDLEEARPYHPRSVGGGLRSMYEMAAALARAGREVELRGVFSPRDLDDVCLAAGARPALPDEPRPPAACDTVIVPEGIDDPEVHSRLVLSPARAVLLLLGPPGLIGWPFAAGWSPPDPLAVDVDAVARPEHFRGAAALGYELWTNAPGLARAAEAAGVACRLVGSGVPGGYPSPPPEKDVDVAWLAENRWAPLARPVVRWLDELGVECVAIADAGHRELLDLLGRARILLHPLRVEGRSRIGCEARAMGAVPVVLASHRFGVGFDEAGGSVPVDSTSEMAGAVVELLGAPDRFARLSAAGMRSAREQVEWRSFVARVDAAAGAPQAADAAHAARAAIGEALRERHGARSLEDEDLRRELKDARAELERHRRWLESTNSSLSWRATAPLRSAKRWVFGYA